MFRVLIPIFLLTTSTYALAYDPLEEDDLLGDDETDDDEADADRLEEGDSLDLLEEEEEFEFSDEENEGEDLLGGVVGGVVPGPVEGADTAALFRAQQEMATKLPTDEAVQSWEAYLEEYPATVFRDRISEIIDLDNEIII